MPNNRETTRVLVSVLRCWSENKELVCSCCQKPQNLVHELCWISPFGNVVTVNLCSTCLQGKASFYKGEFRLKPQGVSRGLTVTERLDDRAA